MTDDQTRLQAIRRAFPAEGLFAEKEWRLSPHAFPLDAGFVVELEKLGYRLHLFQRACNLLYQLSIKGKQPEWIARYLDSGKPPELVALSRERLFRDDIARVIRPDVIPTEDGFTIAELDTVPGGIGLTAWLNQTYGDFGEAVVGGADGMLDGFASILPHGGRIVISDEAATYRPEMRWLAAQLNRRAPHLAWRVVDANEPFTAEAEPRDVYRFFEHFDLPNVPAAPAIIAAAREGRVRVTPPFKPYLEEKLWFALFWMRPLRDFWRRELSERHFLKLQKVIPYTWILDPAPLPHHAVIPYLEINDWRELAGFGHSERDLILKVSGFSELAWGSRGVDLAADLPRSAWKRVVERALERFPHSPAILQRFHKGRMIEHPYFDPTSGEVEMLRGRVRLCPYYFLSGGKANLRGVLATICPADKKLIHGMKEAIIVPCRETQCPDEAWIVR